MVKVEQVEPFLNEIFFTMKVSAKFFNNNYVECLGPGAVFNDGACSCTASNSTINTGRNACECDLGYETSPDGGFCKDINECKNKTDNCNDVSELCTNTNGQGY